MFFWEIAFKNILDNLNGNNINYFFGPDVDANTVAFDTLSEIRINTGNETTFIDGVRTDVGNFVMSGNILSTSTGNMTIDAITKPDMRSDVLMNANLNITGNFSIGQTLTRIGDELTDTVSFNVDLDQDLKPGDGGLHSLGSTAKRWKNVFVSEANIGNVKFFDNQITTNVSNADLDLVANGSGNILFDSNNVQVDNNLEVGKLIVPTLNHTGLVTQTGDIFTNEQEITGTLTTDTLTVARDAFLKQINIEGGNITNIVTNSDLTLNSVNDIVRQKAIKRKLSLKIFEYGLVESVGGNKVKQAITLKQGLNQEIAKKISKKVRDQFKKINVSINGDSLRVASKSKNDLQLVIKQLEEFEESFDIPLKANNFR